MMLAAKGGKPTLRNLDVETVHVEPIIAKAP